ncbi:MAG: phosphate acyltransferase PlsX [Verrucomicrobia bacterium]|nr:phosphate acyltransferase PlsX [Verrucomicrobiota bacterium]
MRIAVDVMGGDHGCRVAVHGAKSALQSDTKITALYLVGNEAEVKPALAAAGLRDARVHVVHASEVLTMEDKPVTGLRKKKDCSILRAVDLVKEGKADAVISPGNTGGIVAASTIRLRTLEGVDRPAIACIIPTEHTPFVLIDGGANPESKPVHLLHQAIMGGIYAREVLGQKRPRIGILSNGTEDIKGNDLVREANKLCRAAEMSGVDYLGFIEGHDLFTGHVDVVVTDGFVGNIVLKTIESMASGFKRMLKSGFTKNVLRQAGAALAQGVFRDMKSRMDPEEHGGAPLLGLNGNVIKVHGSAREKVFANAIRQSATAVAHHLNQHIQREVAAANARLVVLA